MAKIERNNEPLTDTEQEVKDRLFYDPRESLYVSLDLKNALSVLSPRQRECFDLLVTDGFTERESAAKLGISRSSVQEHLKCAREKLKNIFTPTSSRLP